MAKYSVKKPYTVFVAVVAILVLGVVAFTGMTPDLLPNMDLPYVLVITACPGATPERVETMVTKPIEQAMATLDNIENVSSTSSENSSIVVLEFTSDVNMESVTVDILQNISQLQEYWDDTVGSPYILRLNPNMLPVMVAAVEMEGMDTIELSSFVNDTLVNQLEGVTGVASVGTQGIIEETVTVTLDPVKIAAVNQDIRDAINGEFDEAAAELTDAQSEMDGQLGEIESGKDELQRQMDEAAGQLGGAAGQMESGKLEALQMQMRLYDQLTLLTTELQLLKAVETQLVSLQGQQQSLEGQLASTREQLAQLTALQEQVAALEGAMQAFNDQIAAIEANPDLTEEERAAALEAIYQSPEYQQAVAALAEIDAQLAAMGLSRETLATGITALNEGVALAEAALAQLDVLLAELGVDRNILASTLAEMQNMIAQMEAGVAQINGALEMIKNGTMQIGEATALLEQQKLLGTVGLSQAASQIIVGEATLTAALAQVESGLEQIDDAKKEALKQADIEDLLTISNLSQILAAQNFSMPAGYVSKDGTQYLVRVGDTIASVNELRQLLLVDFGIDGLSPVFLQDVASVELVNNASDVYAKLNGSDGVLLTFNKQSTYATATVSDNIREKFDELAEGYPGFSYISLMDQGDYIYIVINSITQSLLFGAVFAILVLLLFLKDLRPTFITLASIPISILFAIVLMYFSGVTINIISLSGLAVAVGMLVDNSVVVIENVYRLRRAGASAISASVAGASQVTGAIASSTLTTICVFLPIVFVEGITRQLFTDMALTITYALLASLVVALTLVPALSSTLLKNTSERENKTINRFIEWYRRAIDKTLRHKAVLLIAVVLLLIASVVLTLLRGYTFMPPMNMPEFTVTVNMPEGSTLEETMAKADEVGARIEGLEDVETVGGMISAGGLLGFNMGGGDANSITYYVLLDEKGPRGGIEVAEEINETFTDMDCEVIASGSSMTDLSALAGSGITVNLFSEDMDSLMASARQVAGVLEGVEGTANVEDGIGDTDPEIRFIVDKNKAMQKGLTTAQVFMEISDALADEAASGSVTIEGDDYDILVLSGMESRLTPDYIKGYSFTVTGRDGEDETVWLSDIAEIVETETARSISRDSQRRYSTVTAEIEPGYNVGLVTQAAQRAMEGEQLATGVAMEFSGENESIMESFVELFKMLGLGVVLVYLIMVAQFQSLKSPFIVMFTIPLAFTGGLLALLLAGMEISVVALIGFVMLVGIIVNNGIVLVDYINQLRTEGAEKRAAIIEAGATRMRPILMTSITTILGLVVMALGTGTGSEMMQPIAIVCIGGLTYATALTLFVIPVLYDMFNKKDMKVVDEREFDYIEEPGQPRDGAQVDNFFDEE